MGVADFNPLEYERAGRLSFIECCIYYGYLKQYRNAND